MAERDGISPDQAEQKIRKVDRERAAYYNSLSDARWGEARNYHLCVDTERLGVSSATDVVILAARTSTAD